MPTTTQLFDKQLGILLRDMHTITENTSVHEMVTDIKQRYKLRHLLPNNYLVTNFTIHVSNPYKDKIMNQDAGFFLDSDISKCDIDDLDDYSGDDIKGIVSILKNIWLDASDDTKGKLWMRMKILVKLCEKWESESDS